MPEVTCIFKFDSLEELQECLSEGKELPKNFKKVFEKIGKCIALKRVWESGNYEGGELVLENEELRGVWQNFAEAEKSQVGNNTTTQSLEEISERVERLVLIKESDFVDELFNSLPSIDIFKEDSLLPPTIDLDDLVKKNTKALGYEGAKNFLYIADVKIEDLLNPSSVRLIDDFLEVQSKKVNVELQKYWHQTVGKKDKIEIVLELKYHKSSELGKPGQPYLIFWIRDKNGRQSPAQRSKGVKWFISFYLKLEASARRGGGRVFLIDEPGANLHAKAQEDILRVFEKQRKNLQIIFTTHSPYLLDMDKVYRILAIERTDTEDEKSETRIIPFQDLGSASMDTLMPLYTNMGIDVSHQTVISRSNNVLLEEISAFFYFKAFWKLCSKSETVNFLPATGCANLPLLANLMLGWGLSFSIVLDDEPHGRKVLKELKDSMVCEEKKLIKIDGCQGIEDLFSRDEFNHVVLKSNNANHEATTNSEFMKAAKLSKVIVARDFMIGVNEEKIKLSNFSDTTKVRITQLLSKIIETL